MTVVKQKSEARPELLEAADKLHSAVLHLLRRLRVRDRESGIGPAQLSALSVLVFGGPRSLGELADAEQVRPPTMSRIVAGLERAGLIRRHATEDGRRVRLEASAKGRKILEAGRQRRVESLAKAMSTFTDKEQRGQRRGSAWFDDDSQNSPERFLGLLDGGIGYQQDAFDMALGDGKHQIADPFRRQGVGGDPSCGAVHRMAGLQGETQCRGSL